MNAGQRIRFLRLVSGATQGALARAVGRSQMWLHRIEQGRCVPNAKKLDALIAVLKSLNVEAKLAALGVSMPSLSAFIKGRDDGRPG